MSNSTTARAAPSTRRNVPALAVGALLSGISAFVLLRDVFAGAPLTPAHLMTVGAIVAAIWSGLEVWSQLAARRLMAACGLGIIFAASTTYVVLMSGANGAATVASKAAAVEANNAARERELKHLARAEKMHLDTADELQAKCVKGKATKGTCDGIRTSLSVYSAAIAGHQARLSELEPPAEAGGAYAAIAKVLAAMPGVTAEVPALTERLVLLIPFLAAIVAELGAIVALHIGFGHRARVPAPVPATQSSFASTPPSPPRGGRKIKRSAPANVIPFAGKREALAALENAGGPVSNRELAKLMGVTDGEASKRVRELGDLVEVRRDGKRVMISLNSCDDPFNAPYCFSAVSSKP